MYELGLVTAIRERAKTLDCSSISLNDEMWPESALDFFPQRTEFRSL